MRARSKAMASSGVERSTDNYLPTRSVRRSTWSVDGDHAGARTVQRRSIDFDMAHHGDGGYLAFLITEITIIWKRCSTRLALLSLRHEGPVLGPRRLLRVRRARWRPHFAQQGSLRDVAVGQCNNDYAALLANNMTHWNTSAASRTELCWAPFTMTTWLRMPTEWSA